MIVTTNELGIATSPPLKELRSEDSHAQPSLLGDTSVFNFCSPTSAGLCSGPRRWAKRLPWCSPDRHLRSVK